MTAYYNEFDPFAAAWLRNLIKAGLIAPGDVDERSIVDVAASDLAGYNQCHFFAGIGGWSYALRLAGVSDEAEVWTGSCPCQPLSSAGLKKGHVDERHLWPAFYDLIAERRPPVVFGEQVASKDGREWLAGVRADLEDARYAVGSADLCAAGVGAPHIRQRLYWVADAADGDGRTGERRTESGIGPDGIGRGRSPGGGAGGMANAIGGAGGRGPDVAERGSRESAAVEPGPSSMGDAAGEGRRQAGCDGRGDHGPDREGTADRRGGTGEIDGAVGNAGRAGPSLREQADVQGPGRREQGGAVEQSGESFWSRTSTIVACRDGKARRIASGVPPLVDGLPFHLGRVRDDLKARFAEEVNNGTARKKHAGEAMRHVRHALISEAIQGSSGGLQRLPQAAVLLAFLLQLKVQGERNAARIIAPREETFATVLRGLRLGEEIAYPSCERGLGGQPTGELADLVCFLSSVLARYAQEAWGEAAGAHAAAIYSFLDGNIGRIGRLKGAGNAIVPWVAVEFIRAFYECRP